MNLRLAWPCALGLAAACSPPPRPAPQLPAAPQSTVGTISVAYHSDGTPLPFSPHPCPQVPRTFEGWKTVDPSTLHEDVYFALNGSMCSWAVSVEGGRVVVEPHESVPPKLPPGIVVPDDLGPARTVLERQAGTLVGQNRGEWGGRLAWFSLDGVQRGTLLEDNVVDILPIADGVIVFSGLDHLGTRHGRATRIAEKDGGFQIGRYVELESAPRAVARGSSGDFLVITGRGIWRVTPELRVDHLAAADWGMFYANSVALGAGGAVYVGMRGIVARVTPTDGGYQERWLVPPSR